MVQNGGVVFYINQYLFEISLFAAFFILSWYYIHLRVLMHSSGDSHPANLPPGPRGWPLIGNLLQLGTQPHVVLAKMAASSYNGGIMTVYLGPMRAVIVSDMALVKQALIRQADSFSDRELPPLLTQVFSVRGSLIWENGENWRQHRRMIHGAFRTFGYRGKQFQNAITAELDALCACLEQKTRENNKLNNLGSLLTSATANVICSVCFGRRYKYDEDEFVTAIESLVRISQALSGVTIAHVIPKLYHTPLYNGVRRDMANLIGFIDRNIAEHKERFDPDNVRDVTDVYLSNAVADGVCSRGVFDLFSAGSETTSDVLLWAILYMVVYPDIQTKVQEELDSVQESDDASQRYPTIINSLPYTYATLLEIHRNVSVTPLSVPRVTSRNTTLAGYDIPKGTSVWVNEHAVHNDPQFWGDPEVFRPSRFLDSSGKEILSEKKCHLVLFGYGLRQCIGKKLAEMESFMMFSGLLRRFTFRTPPGEKTPSTKGHFGLTYSPSPFPVVLKRR